MKKIYLDYAATTPVDPAVEKTMRPYLGRFFGNPGSLHSFGQEAMAAVDEAREKIAKAIGADFREIIFTSSATEANNLALRGTVKRIMNNELGIKNKESIKKPIIRNSKFIIPRVIVSAIEHESILETCRDLKKEDIEIIYLSVDKDGAVQLNALRKSLNENTILVSIGTANNEIGTIQPLKEISEIVGNWKLKIGNSAAYPFFHVDHSQGFQYLDIKPKNFKIDLMTLSSHKIYGPKGAGALFVQHEAWNTKQGRGGMLHASSFMLRAVTTGGGQEFGMRSGTENVPAIVGFGKAVEITGKLRNKEIKRMVSLRNYFWKKIKEIYPRAQLNGIMNEELGIKKKNKNPAIHSSLFQLPNFLNVYFPGQRADELLVKLDLAGIAVSAGSACSARSTKLSHVLEACGFGKERIKSSLRITLGRPTNKAEIDEAIKRMKIVIGK
ncbi:cysteine desulfurase [Candidatus Wolfebacteria bacterium]|nr:cysteine desulfurase [Candidatus Wolfebacteria bacterium]